MIKKISKLIPYGRQNITEQDIQEVVNVLKSPLITQGEAVPKFEKAVANYVGVNYSLAVNSATSALHLACLALDLGPNDYLWTSSTTFVASANCGLYCGAKIDFVDIDLKTGLICIDSLERKLKIASKEGTLPKILIPVHLTGSSCDMKAIKKLSDKYNFHIIEDASHAIGGSYRGDFVGSCTYSSMTIFSFHPVKIITTGEGGMVTTNKKEFFERMRNLRNHGIERDSNKFIYPSNGPWTYEQQELGFNYRMTDFQAAIGLSQLKRLPKIIEERNNQLNIYKDLLKNKFLRFLEIPNNVKSSVHLAVILLRKNDKKMHLDFFNYLRTNNIGVQLHYSPVHLHPYFMNLGFSEGDFPSSEEYASSALSIPLFPGLTIQDQKNVVSLLDSYSFQENI